jgi:hypothetical protein
MSVDEAVAVGDGAATVAGEVDYSAADPTSAWWCGSHPRLVLLVEMSSRSSQGSASKSMMLDVDGVVLAYILCVSQARRSWSLEVALCVHLAGVLLLK